MLLALSLLLGLAQAPAEATPARAPLATLRQRASLEGPHVVRACLPLPPGRRFERGRSPFTVVSGGEEAPTQWELVARYPNGDAAVIELLARVEGRGRAGERRHEVHARPSSAPAPPIPAETARLLEGEGLELRAVDAFGNEYRGRIGGARPARAHRLGPVATTVEHAGWLTPAHSTGDALPRLIGFLAWTTLEAGGTTAGLDLLLHTGPTSAPFPAKVYFRTLELLTPSGWSVEHLWPERAAGGTSSLGGRAAHALIAPSPDGRAHVMLPRARREFRMRLHRGDRAAARAALDAGNGLAIPDPARGLSWCTSGAAGWGPAGFPLPDLLAPPWSFPQAALDAASHDKGRLWTALASGSKVDPGWDQGGAQGPYHPTGWHYGGTTGGAFIWQFEAQLALSGSPAQWAATKAWHRTVTDRHRVALYEDDGRPVVLDAYSGWRIFGGQLQAEGPFRFSAADRRHETRVAELGLAPPSEDFLSRYAPVDTEHLARRLSHSIALAWTDNDPLAQREVFLLAELARAYFWDGNGGNLAQMAASARAQPGRGSGGIGRAFGWTLQAAAAAWALGDDEHRARWRRWNGLAAEALSHAQMSNGMLQAITSGRTFEAGGSRVAMMQAIELGIALNGAACMGNATGDERYLEVVRRGALGLVRYAWRPGHGGPHAILGTRPLDLAREPFRSPDELPAEAVSAGTDSFMIGSTLAYGLCLLEGRPERAEILEAVRLYAGAPSVEQIVPRLAREGMKMFPDSRAPLLSALAGATWPVRTP